MKQKTWILSWVVMLAAGLTAALAGDGHARSWSHSGSAMILHEDGAESFDVGDLADGETRVFGAGDKQITATRSGNVVTLLRNESGDEKKIEILCNVDSDNCSIVTAGDGDSVAIVVQKTRTCHGNKDECGADPAIADFASGEGLARVIIEKHADCEGDDCDEFEVLVSGEGHGNHFFHHENNSVVISPDGAEGEWVSEDGHDIAIAGPNAIFLSADQLVLRCPEGDTTTRIEKDRRHETFLCPQHSVPLEKQKMPSIRRIKIERPHSGDDDHDKKKM
ncbi:MAG: hypothetical protein OEV00_14955 [Acidobacteriota bacterium]|nr:hypothetical protein [Acidobacteriota bacterium]MDH3786610.1 hypothetical protein [Acidobacteriota bacterium]